jgi:4,5-DOPA dioxygenase extradiol
MMPVLFVGHGSPMNAIEKNIFTKGMEDITGSIPKPTAILSISAHWVTNDYRVLTVEKPKTIHDFYGFPQEMYDIEYFAPGSPGFAKKTIELLGGKAIGDTTWGLDHGTWCPLHVMYPLCDIPTFQLSVNQNASPKELFEIGHKLQSLREEGVLIMGSGNIVHNLRLVDFNKNGGFPWAEAFDQHIKNSILQKDYDSIFQYRSLGDIATKSVPTTEHFNPLLYILGATLSTDKVTVFNESCQAGSLSMTSYLFQS